MPAAGPGLDGQEQVIDAYQAIWNCGPTRRRRIDGVEVSQMVKMGTETIVGAAGCDLRPIIMFGLGESTWRS